MVKFNRYLCLSSYWERFIYSLTLVCLLLSLLNPIPTYAAPPPPESPAHLAQPSGAKSVKVALPALPTPDAPQFEEERARDAIQATLEKFLETWGPRYQTHAVEVTVDGDWALGIAQWKGKGNARTFNSPLNILAHRLPDGSWMAMLPDSTEEYSQIVAAAPPNLVSTSKKNEMLSRAKETRKFSSLSNLMTVSEAAGMANPVKPNASEQPVVPQSSITATPAPDQQPNLPYLTQPSQDFQPMPTPSTKENIGFSEDLITNDYLVYVYMDKAYARSIKTGDQVLLDDSLTLVSDKYQAISNSLDVYEITESPISTWPSDEYGFFHGVWSPQRTKFVYIEMQSGGPGFHIKLYSDKALLLYSGNVSEKNGYFDPLGWKDENHILLAERYLLNDATNLRIWQLDIQNLELSYVDTLDFPNHLLGQSYVFNENPYVFIGVDGFLKNGFLYNLSSGEVSDFLFLNNENSFSIDTDSEKSMSFHSIGIIPSNKLVELTSVTSGLLPQSVTPKSARPSPFLYWPIPSQRTLYFYPDSPWTRALGLTHYLGHQGTDVKTPIIGQDVFAAATGFVVDKYNECPNLSQNYNDFKSIPIHCPTRGTPPDYQVNYRGYGWHNSGNVVYIGHTVTINGQSYTWYTEYAHLSQNTIIVNIGDTVQRGQKLAQSGHNGISTAPHLHFEVKNNNDYYAWDDPWGDSENPQTNPDAGTLWVYQNGQVVSATTGNNDACSAPNLSSPSDGFTSPGNNITFSWSHPNNCSGQNGFLVRVGTSPGGSDVKSDVYIPGLQGNIDFASQWYNRDLYWSVRANVSGASWSESRHFRIETNQQSSGCSSYISNFSFSPETPSNATNISVTATISTSFPNFRAARLRVDGGGGFCEGSSYSYSCSNWETRNLSDGDHTVVLEVDDNQGSSWDNPATCTRTYHLDTRPTPPGPSGFGLVLPLSDATIYQSQSVTLVWESSDNATEYQAHLTNYNTVDRYSDWISSTSWSVGQLPSGNYFWSVVARNPYGTSETYERYFTVPVEVPNAPSNLSATTINQSQINLNWDDNSNNETGFRLYREGLLLATLGADINSYQDTGLECGRGYNYYIVAFNGTGESSHSNTTSATTLACTPTDTFAPVLDWAEPVGNEEVYDVVNENITLSVAVWDNVGVTQVHYRRWDAVNSTYVNIGDVYSDPFNIILDCSTLNMGWNEIDAYAFDAAGNVSDQKYIWLNRNEPQPDLVPYVQNGYSDPVTLSSVRNTSENGELHTGQSTYIDWYITNAGWATASGIFYVDLLIDGTRYIHYPEYNFYSGDVNGFEDWGNNIVDTPGWHYVQFVIDPDNAVSESDETNNVWEGWFYWTPSAPYFEDLEGEVDNWEPTGLWHLADVSSAFPQSSSGSNSWWYGQEDTGNYDTGAPNSGDLTSPAIYLPESGAYYLRFKYWYQTESVATSWDQRLIQYSIDGGDFYNLQQLSDDYMSNWHNSPVIDVSWVAGHTLRIRFHFDSVDEVENAYRGWYIDDVEISSTPPPTCADANESNNSMADATPITYGQTLNGDICANGDYDYFKFDGQSGDVIVADIDANVNESSLDSTITLISSDGTILSMNDDDGYTVDSKLGYVINDSGTYYLRVRDYYHPSNGGPEYFYNLTLNTDANDPVSAEIASPLTDEWINPSIQTIAVTAQDGESGISRVEFLWHSADWTNSDWVWLGADNSGHDGWSLNLDTSAMTEQQGGALYIWAFDYGGKYLGAGVWNLGIDRTPPTTFLDASGLYGGAPFKDFYVSWGGEDNLSGIVGMDVQVRDGSGGEWVDMFTNTTEQYMLYVGEDGHTYYFRSRARDAAGNESIYSDGDGQDSQSIHLCAESADGYESDNSATEAQTQGVDSALQIHNFHAQGDEDWVQFNLQRDRIYSIATANTGLYADTVLELYDVDGTTLLQSNDDTDGMNLASRIDWRPASDGVYYARVYHWDLYGYGCTTEYTFGVEDITPEISSLNPDSAIEGSDAVTLAVEGTNLTPTSIVRWNGTDLTTVFVSSTLLNATIPASLITTIGSAVITVYDPEFDGVTSNALTFTIREWRNTPPTVVNDTYFTNENTPLILAAPGVLANDSDIDTFQTLTVVKVTNPLHGTLLLNSDGSFTYTPETDWTGVDMFAYLANDSLADSSVATATITVNDVPEKHFIFLPLIIR